jgi:imidazoleglycerol phosphate synthase glutamine amidotransferase subunit HisH
MSAAGQSGSPAADAAARRVTVIDAGVGNLGNLARALAHLGAGVTVTRDPAQVAAARCLVLPGVGAFAPPREALRGGLEAALRAALADGAWLLGICVGFQLLFEAGEEFGITDGLALLPGRVTRLPGCVPVPHIGWNLLHDLADHPLLAGLGSPDPARRNSDAVAGGRAVAGGGADATLIQGRPAGGQRSDGSAGAQSHGGADGAGRTQSQRGQAGTRSQGGAVSGQSQGVPAGEHRPDGPSGGQNLGWPAGGQRADESGGGQTQGRPAGGQRPDELAGAQSHGGADGAGRTQSQRGQAGTRSQGGAVSGQSQGGAAGGQSQGGTGSAGGQGCYVYFVHSYAPNEVADQTCLARATHGRTFAAVAGRGRVLGTQFHPERSGSAGLRLLDNYLEMASGPAASD